LVELSLVLLVSGVLLSMFSGYASQAMQSGSSQRGVKRMQQLSGRIADFALTHARLPCPDSDGDGVEDCAAGTPLRGAVPYKTLALQQPFTTGTEGQVAYAIAADLGIAANPDNPAWRLDVKGAQDFCLTLSNRNSQWQTPSTTGLAVRDAGASSCNSSTDLSNPAFVLVDSGSDGTFDGVNGSGTCFNSPTKANSQNYDDRVLAVGMPFLIGRICQ